MISGPWGHDRIWERSVVERIRRDGVAPQAHSLYESVPHWDAVAAYAGGWEYAEARSKDAIRTNSVYLNDQAIAARALQRKLLREGIREALAKAKERQKKLEADRLAEAAARREAQRAWEAKQEERARKAREDHLAWEAEVGRRYAADARRRAEDRALHERERILGSKWTCTVCNGASLIKRDGDGYRITCAQCGKTAFGSHASLWGVLSK